MANVRGAITLAEQKRGREYTPKQKKFLTEYAKNNFSNPREAAEKAGYANHYWQMISSLKDDIKEIAEALMVGAAPEAASTVYSILTAEKPIPAAQTKLAAAKEILDRAGVVKTEKVDHNHQVSGGLFLLPMKMEIPVEQKDDEYIDVEWEDQPSV